MKPGDKLGPLVKSPITTRQLVMYAGASGDFNPIHYDHPFATAGGYKSVIAHGMLSMAFFGQLLAKYEVRRIAARFKAVTYPGDVVTVEGEVVSVENGLAELKLTARTQAGTITLEGTATIVA
jgi:peroxisomal enoyl-CoA hydratase 2